MERRSFNRSSLAAYGIGMALAAGLTHTGGRLPAPTRTSEQVRASFARAPLYFERDQGQVGEGVRFLARSGALNLAVTGPEAVLTLSTGSGSSVSPRRGHAGKRHAETPPARRRAKVRMRLAGAHPAPRVRGEEELPTKVNYFPGRDPKGWRTNVPTFAKVRCEEVYPGIDLLYHGSRQQLEYDFVVAPGADPDQIRLEFPGVERAEVTASGDLAIHTEAGELRQRKPFIYQEVAGTRRPMEGGYVLRNPAAAGEAPSVTLRVASYDGALPLIIDPVLNYSTFLGGSSEDNGTDVAVDADGNAYVTGSTSSTDFPPDGAVIPPFDNAVFVSKLNASGTAVLFTSFLGGGRATGIALDGSRNIYLTGATSSVDFPVTANPAQAFPAGGQDAYVAKLSPSGSALLYSTYLGGTGDDDGRSIAVDGGGRAVVVGDTGSADFPTVSAFQGDPDGESGEDGFVAKLNAQGTQLVYSTYLGGQGRDFAEAVAVNGAGEAFVTGGTEAANFPVTAAAALPRGGGAFLFDAYVARLNAAGTSLVYSTYLGGSAEDFGIGIAIDTGNNAYVAGETGSDDFPATPGAFDRGLNGAFDAFVAKVNPTGTRFLYAAPLGGTRDDFGLDIAVDAGGRAYVTGATQSADFPLLKAFRGFAGGFTDAFVSRVNAAGSALEYSVVVGGEGRDQGKRIAVDSLRRAYVVGSTASEDFPASGFDIANGGGNDAFVLRLELLAAPGAPSGLTAVALSATQVKLTWQDNADNEDGFEIQRTTTGSGFATVAAAGRNGTTVTDTRLRPNTVYTYRVRAFNIDAVSAFSAQASATTPAGQPAPPAAPNTLAAAADTSSEIRLAWKDNSNNEDGFRIERRPPGGTFAEIAVVGANIKAFADSGLSPGSSFTYRVRAFNADGNSGFSNASTATTLAAPAPPSSPAFANASTDGSTRVVLRWTDTSNNEAGFRIERKTGNGGFIPFAAVPADVVEFLDSPVAVETTFTYRVSAFNADGDSGSSQSDSVTTLAAPSNLAVVNLVADGAVRLNWQDKSSLESAYVVERKLEGESGFTDLTTLGPNVTTFQDTGLPADKFVDYQVRAVLGEDRSSAVRKNIRVLRAPIPLRILSVSETSITLVWLDRSNAENSYRIERRREDQANFSFLFQTEPNVQTFVNQNLPTGVRFFYRVVAASGPFQSAFSNVADAKTGFPIIPVAPTEVAARLVTEAEPGTDRQVEVTWKDNSVFEDEFRVERKVDSGAFRPLGTTPKNGESFTDTDLPEGTHTLTYRVRACNHLGCSPYSDSASVEIPFPPGGRLEVARRVDFGLVPRGGSRGRSLVLRNTSAQRALQVRLEMPSGPFTLVGGERTVTIPSGGQIEARLLFSPTRRGRARGRIWIASSDPGRGRVRVRLLGRGL